MKNLLISFFVAFAMMFALSTSTNAAVTDYQITVQNVAQVGANSLMFDVYIFNNSGGPIVYATGQYCFNFNAAILNGGTGTLAITNTGDAAAAGASASSELPATQLPRNPTVFGSLLQFASNSALGSGNSTTIEDQSSILVMRVQLTTSANTLAAGTPDITFVPFGGSGLTSSLTTYVDNINTNQSAAGNVSLYDYAHPDPSSLANNPVIDPAVGADYQFTVTNTIQTSPTTMTFEVHLLNNTSSAIKYGVGQYYFNYNRLILNGGTGALTIVQTDLPTAFKPTPSILNVNTSTGILKFAANTSPVAANALSIPAHSSILVFKAQLAVTNKTAFATQTPNISNRLRPLYMSNLTNSTLYNSFSYYVTTSLINSTTADPVKSTFYEDNSNPTLPVELSSFTSVVKQRDVELKWNTATEVGVSHFEIERSSGSSWTTVANNIKATGGSNAPQSYNFTDRKLNAGTYTYRLKMVDNDGSFQYSKQTVEGIITSPKTFELSQNYPNPFNPSTKIDYQVPADAKVSLELYSVTGQKVATLVNEEKTAGYYSYSFSANSVSAGLASGLYIYRVVAQSTGTGEKFVAVKKMILLK